MATDRRSGALHGTTDYQRQWNHDEAMRRIRALEDMVDKSGTALPTSGDFFGQCFFLSTTSKWYKWNGSTWDILN